MPQVTNPEAISDDQIEAYIRSIAKDEANKFAPKEDPAPSAPPAPSPLKMNLGGQEYNFSTPEEAQATINNLMTQQALQREQASSQGRKVTSDEGPAFETSTWIEKMQKDPIAAQEYMDEYRFGFKNPAKVIKEALQAQVEQSRVLATYAFKEAHPDYEGNDENAQAMAVTLQRYNLPWNPQGLDAAYALAKQQNLIRSTAKAEEPVTPAGRGISDPESRPYNPYLAAPPKASRTGHSDAEPSWMDMAETLPLEEIEKIFSKFQ